jgi:hypothetical protein
MLTSISKSVSLLKGCGNVTRRTSKPILSKNAGIIFSAMSKAHIVQHFSTTEAREIEMPKRKFEEVELKQTISKNV